MCGVRVVGDDPKKVFQPAARQVHGSLQKNDGPQGVHDQFDRDESVAR